MRVESNVWGRGIVRERENPFLAASHARKIVNIVGIYICVFTAISQSSGLSTLLPVAANEIGGMDIYPLASSFSGPVSIALMPLFGYLAARNPAIKLPLFVTSMLVGALCLFLRGIAPDMMVIVVSSLLYGIVSAGVFVLGLTTIRDLFDKESSGLYLGVFGTMQALGMVAGSILTGVVLDTVGWRAMCFILFALFVLGGLICLFGGVRVTKAQVSHLADANAALFDVPGTLALVVFLFALIMAISTGKSLVPFGSPLSNILFAIAAAGLLALVIVIARKQERAIIPPRVIKNRNVLCLCLGNVFLSFANMPVFFFIPSYVINVMGGSALLAAVSTMLLGIPGIFLGPILCRIIARRGTARDIILLGIGSRFFLLVGLIVLLRPDIPYVLLFALLFVFGGIASSVQQDAFVTGSQVQLSESIRVQGASVVSVGQNTGSVIGVAIATLAVSSMGVANGLGAVFMASAAVVLAAIVPTVLLRKGGPEASVRGAATE